MSDGLTRRRLLRRGGAAAGAAALGSVAGGALGAAAAEARADTDVNILLIVVNGIRSDSVGAFDGSFDDNRIAKTPNIDDLAGDSLRFERAVPESTPAVPARRALISGRRSFPYRDWRREDGFADVPGWNGIYERQPLVTESLRDAGVETVWITDNPLFTGPRYTGVVKRTSTVDPNDYSAPKDATGTLGREQTRDEVERYLVGSIKRGTEATQRAVREGIRQLDRFERLPKGKRFFLAVDAFDPAEAYAPPRTWTRSLELDPSMGAELDRPSWIVPADIDDGTVALARNAYMDGLESVDAAVGLLIDKLDSSDLGDRTAVFLISDGHTMLGEHGWLGRGAPGSYQHAYFAPLLIRDPHGRRSGNYSYYYASTQDIAPTALSMLGIDRPGRMDGEDLTALLDDEDPPKRTAFMSACITSIAMGDPRWLMLSDMQAGNRSLHDFDPDSDDDEEENVLRKHPPVVEELWKLPLAAGQGTMPRFNDDSAVRPPPEDDDKDDDGIPDNDETNDAQSGAERNADRDDLDFDQQKNNPGTKIIPDSGQTPSTTTPAPQP